MRATLYRIIGTALLTAAWMLVPCAASLSELRAQTRQLSLEANPFHGTLGYGWMRGPSRVIGLTFGIGFPQLDRTLVPAGDETLLDFAHVGAFVRIQPFPSLAVDGRLQLGLAELHGCSGCFLGGFTAVSGGVFWGGRHLKVGPRLTAGVINERNEPAEFVVNLTPIAVLITYSR